MSGVDYVVHVAFIIHVACYNMQWSIALHMNRDITLNGCECIVESTLHLVIDWVSSVLLDNV